MATNTRSAGRRAPEPVCARSAPAPPPAGAPDPSVCQCCGGTEDLLVHGPDGDDVHCEDCLDEEYEFCTVCDDYVAREGGCRHLSWTENGFVGAGATDDPDDEQKNGVFAFFDLLDTLTDDDGDNLARAALREIARHRFFTQMQGAMLGTPDLRLCRLRFDLHPDTVWRPFGTVRQADMDGFDEAALADGYEWLATLEDAATQTANRLTVKWVREWRTQRRSGARPLPAGKTMVRFLAKLPDRPEREVAPKSA